MKMGKTLHPTPHTLPPRKTFSANPILRKKLSDRPRFHTETRRANVGTDKQL